jgi:hypothetical protein
MRKSLVISLLGLMAVSVTATAQDLSAPKELLLPGSINGTFGTVGSLEPGNVLGAVVVEQGVRAWRRGPLSLVGFVDLTVRADTKGYSWNNTTPYVTGVKFVVAGSASVLQAAVGVAGDVRDAEIDGVMPAVYVTFWKGWQPPTRLRKAPGRLWATSGVSIPREKDNWITTAHVDQGITVWRAWGNAMVPFAAATGVVDTKGYNWNNRGFVDGGVKFARNIKDAVVDFGVAQRAVREWKSGATHVSPVVFVNFWMGWTPHVVH